MLSRSGLRTGGVLRECFQLSCNVCNKSLDAALICNSIMAIVGSCMRCRLRENHVRIPFERCRLSENHSRICVERCRIRENHVHIRLERCRLRENDVRIRFERCRLTLNLAVLHK